MKSNKFSIKRKLDLDFTKKFESNVEDSRRWNPYLPDW